MGSSPLWKNPVLHVQSDLLWKPARELIDLILKNCAAGVE
jgi:hypothetical protein